MGEVLADAAPFFHHFLQRRRHGGGHAVVFEIGVDAAVQIQHRGEQGRAGGETGTGVVGQGGIGAQQGRVKYKFIRLHDLRRNGIGK
jgi:hypothetical protein